jgi:hypothetical protein
VLQTFLNLLHAQTPIPIVWNVWPLCSFPDIRTKREAIVRAYELRQQREVRAYYRQLQILLADEVQRTFSEVHAPLTQKMSDLMREFQKRSLPSGKAQ